MLAFQLLVPALLFLSVSFLPPSRQSPADPKISAQLYIGWMAACFDPVGEGGQYLPVWGSGLQRNKCGQDKYQRLSVLLSMAFLYELIQDLAGEIVETAWDLTILQEFNIFNFHSQCLKKLLISKLNLLLNIVSFCSSFLPKSKLGAWSSISFTPLWLQLFLTRSRFLWVLYSTYSLTDEHAYSTCPLDTISPQKSISPLIAFMGLFGALISSVSWLYCRLDFKATTQSVLLVGNGYFENWNIKSDIL